MGKKPNKTVVLSVRLDETTVAAVDLLVEAGLAQSRSEAASRFIGIGVRSSEPLIVKAMALAEQVRSMKLDMLEAVKSKNLDKVRHLLALDETLKNAKAEDGQTAVLMAAYYRAHEIKELLLANGVELNVYEAAAVGNTARVEEIVRGDPQRADSHSFDGYTPLGLAAHFGHAETAAKLLQAGADANLKSRDGKLNNTPLHAAIAGNGIAVVRLLLAHGGDPNARCEGELRRGFTPLHVAAHFNRAEMVPLLLAHGADPLLTNAAAQTAEAYALAKGNDGLAALLAGVDRPQKEEN